MADDHRPALVWLRRDLRLDDQPALEAAAASGRPVACAFVLDPALARAEAGAARLRFLLEGLRDLDERLRARGGGLLLRRGDAVAELVRLVRELDAAEVHACADEAPYARRRDAAAAALLRAEGVALTLHHDRTLVRHEDVARADGGAYRTYSSYARAVDRVLGGAVPSPFPEALAGRLRPVDGVAAVPDPPPTGPRFDLAGGETAGLARLRAWRGVGLARYEEHRNDVWDPDATSRLAPYLKLGMVSPRRCAAVAAAAGARKWLAELRWRDFYAYVLHHHPDLADRPLDRRAEALAWPGDDAAFAAWCRGETGFGLVDAGMRQLAATGFLPNRVRMVCASFLVKDLHVDWRRGERWFRSHLVCGDLAQNAGNWQWVAGVGTDAAPYFRIFNPDLQERRFDPDGAYVRRWAPDRPAAIVDHAVEREHALARYGAALRDAS